MALLRRDDNMDKCTPGNGNFCMLIQASMIEMSRGSIRIFLSVVFIETEASSTSDPYHIFPCQVSAMRSRTDTCLISRANNRNTIMFYYSCLSVSLAQPNRISIPSHLPSVQLSSTRFNSPIAETRGITSDNKQ